MAVLMPEGRQSFTNSAGEPLVGGKVFTYQAGTNTPLATYSDAAGTTPNTNPIILDGRGEAVIFWSGSYKVVLTDASNVTIWTQDNIVSTEGSVLALDLINSTDPAKGAGMVGFGRVAYPQNTIGGAAFTTVWGDGVTDKTAELVAANALGYPIRIKGVLSVLSPVTITVPILDTLTQIFTPTSAVTISNGLAVRPDWWGSAAGNINRAVNALPATGGVVLLADGVYSPITSQITKSGVTIIGTKRPRFKSDNTGLEAGSIVQGPFSFRADNLTFSNFGVDSGSAVCTALYGGAAQEGFLSGLPVASRNKRLNLSNLVSICKDSAALVHAFALEGYEESEVHGLMSQYGVHGVSLKMTDSNVSDIQGRGHGFNTVVIKSDTATTTAERLNVVNVVCESVGAYDGGGVRFTNTAGGQVLVGVNLRNVVCNRTTYGVEFDCNDTHLIDSVNIDGLFMYVCQTTGFKNIGQARRCKVSHAVAFNCGAQGFLTAKAVGAGSGNNVPEVDFFNCVAANCSIGFDLYGRNGISHCHANDNVTFGFYAEAASRVRRIACDGSGNGTALFGPVSGAIWYPGNSTNALQTPTLQNAWVDYGVSTQPARYFITDDGEVRLTGMIKSGVLGSACMTLPVGYRPPAQLWFICSSSNGALVPTHVVVNADGTVVPQAGGGNTFLSLDNISFRMDLT